MRKVWYALGMLGFLTACSQAGLDLILRRGGYRVERDLAYGTDPRQTLDLYIPKRLTGPAPVLLFFYGGGWTGGSKARYFPFGHAFASKGIITAVADYRLYPQVRYPAFVEDGARAFAWLRNHAGTYGGDPGRLFLAGHSAGAYIAVMLAADRQYLQAAGVDPASVRGVIGIAGPYDFLPLKDDELVAIFSGANRPETQPVHYIDGARPPMLLATGTKDTIVSPANTSRLAARLRAFASPVQERLYPGIGHVGIILSLLPGLRGRTSLYSDMLEFVRSDGAMRDPRQGAMR